MSRQLSSRPALARGTLRLALAGAAVLRPEVAALAQSTAAEDAAACAACGTCGGLLILVPIVFIAVNVALLVWVARDAKARGMDSAVLWMLLVLFTSVLGVVIYLLSRPQGELVQCAHCGNQRLQASATCPHCGNA
jgi:hypothetical protein